MEMRCEGIRIEDSGKYSSPNPIRLKVISPNNHNPNPRLRRNMGDPKILRALHSPPRYLPRRLLSKWYYGILAGFG